MSRAREHDVAHFFVEGYILEQVWSSWTTAEKRQRYNRNVRPTQGTEASSPARSLVYKRQTVDIPNSKHYTGMEPYGADVRTTKGSIIWNLEAKQSSAFDILLFWTPLTWCFTSSLFLLIRKYCVTSFCGGSMLLSQRIRFIKIPPVMFPVIKDCAFLHSPARVFFEMQPNIICLLGHL